MAAGLGFKTFTTGEVLTAANVNGYLMQGVLVFASAAARDAAITSPQEGQFAYLKDTNVTTYYTGAAWANLDTTGMTNPMTTTGDIVYASSGSTPGRIGIGSTGNVLTVAGGIPSWAAPSSGALTLISTTTFSASSAVNINNVFSATYDRYLVVGSMTSSNASVNHNLRLRASGTDNTTASSYVLQVLQAADTTVSTVRNTNDRFQEFTAASSTLLNAFSATFFDPFVAAPTTIENYGLATIDSAYIRVSAGTHNQSTSYDGFSYIPQSGTVTGSISVYGLAK